MNKLLILAVIILLTACHNKEKYVNKIDIKKRKDKIDHSKNMNYLGFETSPYLLQHKDNPVNWNPWKDFAFEKAVRENKPIFLSIGYSTCHWCHVMEHQSFEDKEVAKYLNENFISIKVDREERPDVDEFYMDIAQKMTGRGGWPLTIIMTPDKKPFFAGTYFPKHRFLSVLSQLSNKWKTDQANILKLSEEIIKEDQKSSSFQNMIDDDILKRAGTFFTQYYDRVHGGFKRAPKFPSPHQWIFLIKYATRTDNQQLLNIALTTLKKMRYGGMYDQIGFGFHRYSTDVKWLVPHFEKMLYDQAMLIWAFSEAYGATKDKFYKDVVEEIYQYLEDFMKYKDSIYYSAEDADSDGAEGKYYVWTKDELNNLLDKDEKWILEYFHVEQNGNFRASEHHLINKNIPYLTESTNIKLGNKLSKFEQIRVKLLKYREKRVKPHRDEKILIHWNAMTALALSRASILTNEKKYGRSAKKILDFILKNMVNSKKELIRSYKTEVTGFLTDYAYLTAALLEYYQVSFESKYLQIGIFYVDMMMDKFFQDDRFTTVQKSDSNLPTKTDSIYDGAKPSGQSIAIKTVLKYSLITRKYSSEMKGALNRALSKAKNYPIGYSTSLDSLNELLASPKEIVITGSLESKDTQKLLHTLNNSYYPYKVILFNPDRDKDGKDDLIYKIYPFIKNQKSLHNKATAYVCEAGSCKKPTSDAKEMLEFMKK